MADPNAPQGIFINVGGGGTNWKMIDGIDVGASQINIAGTWKNITEMHINIGGVWKQFFSNTAPGATTLSTRAFTNTGFNASWTNPSGVWQQEIRRRLQSAADIETNYEDVHAKSTTVRTSFSNTTGTGTSGESMADPVIGSTTNIQGPRYVYRIRNWDNFGHVSELQIDTLRGRVVSPLYVRATDSATYRGSAFRADLTVQAADSSYSRCIQGYTTTGMNYGHYWYGGSGNGIVNNCFSNSLLPTVTAAQIMLCRDAGGIGDGSGTVKPTMWMHGQLSKGTTNAWSSNGTNVDAGTGHARETQIWQSINTTNGGYLVAGTYKGICLYNSSTTVESYGTSASYFVGYSRTEPQNSQYPGTLEITHTG